MPVNGNMQVLKSSADGEVVPHVYCIGDANGKMMLAHAASAQVQPRPPHDNFIVLYILFHGAAKGG